MGYQSLCILSECLCSRVSPLLLTEITSSLGNQLLHVNEAKDKKSIKHRKEPQRFNGPVVKSNRLRLSVRLERQRRTLIAE